MELSQLNNLIRSVDQNNLYDLIVFDFKSNISIAFKPYFVEEDGVMRIDNVCKNIYSGDVDSIDFLLSLNDIDNPLNIMAGDIIYYCDYDNIELFKNNDILNDIQTGSYLLNPNKSVKRDTNRESYIENGYLLAPTYNQTATSAVKIEGNKIKLG